MIRDVLRMGDPRLLEVSEPIGAFGTPELLALLDDLNDTMAAMNGAGIAAPQIGVLNRVVIFGFDHNPRYPEAEAVPFTVLCNPVITPLSEAMEDGWEGCLSVPGMRGLVPRFKNLRYRGRDQFGNEIDRTVTNRRQRSTCLIEPIPEQITARKPAEIHCLQSQKRRDSVVRPRQVARI